jgi:hypothetical protein
MFAQPLTDTRRPPLTHTSALATPGPAGTVASATTVAAANVHDRVHCFIVVVSFRHPVESTWKLLR